MCFKSKNCFFVAKKQFFEVKKQFLDLKSAFLRFSFTEDFFLNLNIYFSQCIINKVHPYTPLCQRLQNKLVAYNGT